jgi:hypothetical protein
MLESHASSADEKTVHMVTDFEHVDDVVDALHRSLDLPPLHTRLVGSALVRPLLCDLNLMAMSGETQFFINRATKALNSLRVVQSLCPAGKLNTHMSGETSSPVLSLSDFPK